MVSGLIDKRLFLKVSASVRKDMKNVDDMDTLLAFTVVVGI